MNPTRFENKMDFQSDLKQKLKDLKASLRISNIQWNEWEREFITNVTNQLDHEIVDVSPKQFSIVWDLWEKI